MAGKSVTRFDLYRANLSFALQMVSFSHEARQQVSEFEMQRIRRDLAAAHAIRNAVSTAHDWSELSASEVDPEKRTSILWRRRCRLWASIVPRTRRNFGRKWSGW
ncbi:hypothetical protein OKW30_007884 [Paraburkholderia sp. Clong3]|uniref:hypothetical protein n=1 Tax=Paraburkholderia sp. Clong3 TaxID=2991061 RepID=UPI003D25CA7E